MNYSKIAQKLGRRGGLKRAKNLSEERRKEIAKMGAKARVESLLLEKRIKSNFYYVDLIRELNPPPQVLSQSKAREKLPGIYEKDKKK